MDSLGSLSPGQAPADRQHPASNTNEEFCRKYLNWSAIQANALWAYEPQRVIWRAIRLPSDGEAKIIEAVRSVFSFSGVFPTPSRSFYDVLGQFPLKQLFTTQNKMSVSKFVESQKLLRLAAIHLHDFFRLYPTGTFDQFTAYFAEKNLLSHADFSKPDKTAFDCVLPELFKSVRYAPSPEQLDTCFLHRIYTLKNALNGIHNPAAVLKAMIENVKKSPPQDQVPEMLQRISSLGKEFLLTSIKLHFHQLAKESIPDQFERNLQQLCNGVYPFVQRATLTVQQERIDYATKCSDVLKAPNPTGDNSAAALTCTFLQPLLTCFGHQAEIFTRRDIDPTLSYSFAHAFLVVTDSVSRRKFIIDPTYKQFFYGIISESGDELNNILIFDVDELDGMIEQFVELRRGHPAGNGSPIRCLSDEELRHHFKRIWGLEGSSLVTLNRNGNSIFSNDPFDGHKGYLCAKELVRAIGLEEQLRLPTMVERVASLKKKASTLAPIQILEELRTIYDIPMAYFIEYLSLDPRPVRSQLLSAKAVGYFMALREVVNPENNSQKIALYGCAGSDLSPLLALNADHLYMVERTPVGIEALQVALHKDFRRQLVELTLPNYKAIKAERGGQLAGNPDPKKDYHDKTELLEVLIVAELEALGVDLDKVKVAHAPQFNGVTLSFPWASHGQKTKNYQVTWISAHLEEPESYPPGLGKLLAGGRIDYYYQKAANHAPKNYGQFLPKIAQAIREGGYLLTSDYDMFGKKHPPEDHLQLQQGSFTLLEDTPLIAGYKRLFQGMLPLTWVYEFKGKMEDRFTPPSEEYFVFMDVRKKTTVRL